jgi:hypothetical protein
MLSHERVLAKIRFDVKLKEMSPMKPMTQSCLTWEQWARLIFLRDRFKTQPNEELSDETIVEPSKWMNLRILSGEFFWESRNCIMVLGKMARLDSLARTLGVRQEGDRDSQRT